MGVRTRVFFHDDFGGGPCKSLPLTKKRNIQHISLHITATSQAPNEFFQVTAVQGVEQGGARKLEKLFVTRY